MSRTGVDGLLLKEAKSINLSLHYLQQVIIALQERADGKRFHVPYRNSFMTSVLKDSLGGNCQTAMIATLSMEEALIEVKPLLSLGWLLVDGHWNQRMAG